jgi:hypothetical protein
MARRNHIPSYRLHKASGQAVVTLTDAALGVRKDRFLGPHGTAGSRAEYARVIAEWEARGRRLDDPGPADLTVAELLVRFLAHAKTYYGAGSKEYDHFEKTTVPLTDTYPHKPAKVLPTVSGWSTPRLTFRSASVSSWRVTASACRPMAS